MNAKGNNSDIQGVGTILNLGCGAGNPNHSSEKIALKGCSGTKNALNADGGGKINLNGVVVNAGAFSGNPTQRPVVHEGSRTACYEDERDPNPKIKGMIITWFKKIVVAAIFHLATYWKNTEKY